MKKNNLWSREVKAKWHPEKGFFEQPAEKIAKGLKDASDSHAQAIDRLNFYINRAGKNLSIDDKDNLENAKKYLRRAVLCLGFLKNYLFFW